MSTHASSTPASGAKAKAAVATAAAPLRRFGESAIATRANAFTIARLVLTAPVLLLIVVEGASWVTVTGWVVLACTDGVDGWVAVALVAARELGVSAFRSLAGRRGISLPARQLGKWKANVQFAAVVVVLFPPTADATALQIVVLWVAVAITLLSGLDIVRRGWQET